MPVDKHPKGSTNQPITPALSSRFRTTKTPIAPRLAASSPASPTVTARKDLREQTLSPPTEQHAVLAWNGNITPRSGARNTRISTDSPASPASARRLSGSSLVQGITSFVQQRTSVASPSANPPPTGRLVTKPSSTSVLTARRTSGSSTASKKDEDATKFVRANDARAAPTFQSPKSTLSPRPLSTSFLKSESPRTTHSAPPSAVNSTKHDKDQRFARANEGHLRATQTLTMARKQSNTSLASTSMTRTRSPEVSRTQGQTQVRPWAQSPSSSRQGSPQKPRVTGITTRPPISPKQVNSTESLPAIVSPNSPSSHRRSFGSNVSGNGPSRPFLHRKSASVSSFGPITKMFANQGPGQLGQHKESIWALPAVAIPTQRNDHAIASPDSLSPRSASLASSKTVGTSVTSDTDASEISKIGSVHPQSSQVNLTPAPDQSSQMQPTPFAQAQIAAASARRERKVLDLEISNSSLLAINKTLEKELRKQSAELRRFRRLSRSGRLSFAPSNRSVSGQSMNSLDTLQEQVEDEMDISDEDEDEQSDTNTVDDEDDLQDDLGDSMTVRARQRARDERRLMLDLSKHQQILVDSQKLTQSIKKCLSVSEDLIKEGRQALKYKVGIGDVPVGGRVLTAEDFDFGEDPDQFHGGEVSGRKALLSPSLTTAELQQANLWLLGVQSQAGLVGQSVFEAQEPD